jgi:VWFA-related protein
MNTRSSRRLVVAVVLLPAIVAVSWSSERRVGAQGAPAGSVGTISFRALSGEGQPITDLKAADVSLKIDNTPREIKSLDFVTLGQPASGVATVVAPSVPPPFASNAATGPARRSLVLLVDEESIAPGKEQTVREAVNHVIAGVGPRDRVALMSMRQGGPRSDLTEDRDAVNKALAALGGYGSGRETANDLRCRTLRMVQNLQATFGAQTTGGAGTVLLFSTSVAAFQPGQTARIGGQTGSDLCELRTEHFNQLASAVHTSRSNFYVVEVMDASGGQIMSEAAGGLENLAGVTGGEMVRLSTNMDAQMSRVLRETSAYYVVSFEDGERGGGGQNRRIELTVTRGNVAVKAPKELARAAGGKKAAATPKDMIRTASAFTDLPLRAAAYSSRNTGDGKIKVLALFEPVDEATKLNAVVIGMFDKAGKLQAQWTAQGNELSGPTGVAGLLVEPGTYRMRVAATDAAGRAGAVDSDVSAAIVPAGPIHLGDLVLGRMGQKGPVPALQFGNEAEALAMLELYGRPAGPLTAYVEVTNGGEGEPLVAVPLQPSATSEPDKFILSAKLALGSLKPGDYLVRAVVGVQGQEGKITRTLRKIGS